MPTRWGIIGCGDVTEVKSGPGFQNAERSALTAVMRRNAALAEDYARRHNVPRWYDNAEALIRDAEVDAVYIATPPGSHVEYALQAAAAGKPAYIEKPMARSHAGCQRIVAAFQAAKLPLFVAYYRRALPRFLKAKEILDRGDIGQVTGVGYRFTGIAEKPFLQLADSADTPVADPATLPWRLRADEAGGGLFLDLGCHTLDILDFLLGPLGDVEGMAANVASCYEVEDVVAMQFRTPGGAVGVASWNFVGSRREDLITIDGVKGRISLSTFGNEPVVLETAEGRQEFDLPNPRHIQQPLIQTIVDTLHGAGSCPSTGETAARTSRVIDTVLEDFYGGREDAFWERPGTWPGRRANPRCEI